MRISKQAKQERRKRIQEIATELFIREGFEAVTIRNIAKSTGMATGTLFNYFPSKEALAMDIVSEAFHRGQETYQQCLQGHEDLNECLYLLISSGLRELKPLRPFLAPVLERSLSPFPKLSGNEEGEHQGESVKQPHLSCVQNMIQNQGIDIQIEDITLNIYWSLYLGILAFWLKDSSPQQQQSQAMIDYSLRVFVQTIQGSEPIGAGSQETAQADKELIPRQEEN